MGLVEKQQPDEADARNDLNLNLELEISDREFPETKVSSIYNPR